MLLARGLFFLSSLNWLVLRQCLFFKWESQEVKKLTLRDRSIKTTIKKKISTPNMEVLVFWKEGVLCFGSTNRMTWKHTVVFHLPPSVWVLNGGCLSSSLTRGREETPFGLSGVGCGHFDLWSQKRRDGLIGSLNRYFILPEGAKLTSRASKAF